MAQAKSKKSTAKTAPAKKAAEKPAKAPVKKAAPKKAAPQKAAPKKAAPKKAAPQKAAPKKAAPKKAEKKSVTSQKATKKTATTTTEKKKAMTVPAVNKKAPAQKSPKKETARKTAEKGTTRTTTAPSLDSYSGFTPYQAKAGEEYMNESQQRHFLSILNAWKKELMEKVDETVHHMQDDAGNFPDPNDRATQESDFTMELRTRDRERKLIKKIEGSISHIGSGEYGYCENCGEEIGIRRLEARPTAQLCIDCKTLDEIREKHVNR